MKFCFVCVKKEKKPGKQIQHTNMVCR